MPDDPNAPAKNNVRHAREVYLSALRHLPEDVLFREMAELLSMVGQRFTAVSSPQEKKVIAAVAALEAS